MSISSRVIRTSSCPDFNREISGLFDEPWEYGGIITGTDQRLIQFKYLDFSAMIPNRCLESLAGPPGRSFEMSAWYDWFQNLRAAASQTGVARKSGGSDPLWHRTHFASKIGWITFGKLKPLPVMS